MRKIKLYIGGILSGTLVLMLVSSPALAVAQTVVFDNIATPQPGNVVSWGFEATSTSEIGTQITLAGTERNDPKVTVLMSSWGCESGNWFNADCVTTPGATFNHPITLNIYAVGVGDEPGALLTTKTASFDIPYRPSTDGVNCTGGRWYNGTTCYNGLAHPISFSLSGFVMPNKVIVSVAYNTSHYGYSPLGELACFTESGGCGYDSLNVGIETSLSTGSFPLPNDGYLNSSWSGAYCNVGATGTFRLDTGCWADYQPSLRVEANVPLVGPPTNKDQCKKNGWQAFNSPKFKNQGDCVSYVATGGRNPGNGPTF